MDIQKQVSQALDSIRPILQEHGGNIKLMEITDNYTVKLSLCGQCSHCPKSGKELKNIVLKSILKMAPLVEKVEIVPETTLEAHVK